MTKKLVASKDPAHDIDNIMYEGQPFKMRMYREGYEHFFNQLPVLKDQDPCLMKNIAESKSVFHELGEEISRSYWVKEFITPPPGEFNRTIIALESPHVTEDGDYHAGKEILVAKWGDGFVGPVHGHAAGYEHEYLLFGQILVNTYFMPYQDKPIARFVEQKLYNKRGDIIAGYYKNNPANQFKRQDMIHNFESIGFSASLHYVPEYSRDGRDNTFRVESFEDRYEITWDDLDQIKDPNKFKFEAGDVFLVRSKNVPHYKTHFMVITDPELVEKPYGMRPQEIVIPSKSILFDNIEDGVIMYKLRHPATYIFHQFHNIKY